MDCSVLLLGLWCCWFVVGFGVGVRLLWVAGLLDSFDCLCLGGWVCVRVFIG